MRIARILALVVAALACAAISNMTAGKERKLAWVGRYSPASRPPSAAAQPAGSPTPSSASPAVGSVAGSFAPHPDRAWVEIASDAVEPLHRQGVLFLDARRSSVYKGGHIPGARSFPVWESDIDARVKALFEEGRDQRAPVVIYCSGGDCEDSHMLAEKLYFIGFDNALVYKGGFPDWQKRGLPVTTGVEP